MTVIPSCGTPTCVAWSPSSDNVFLCGDTSGQVSIFDVRQSQKSLFTQEVAKEAMHRIVFSSKR